MLLEKYIPLLYLFLLINYPFGKNKFISIQIIFNKQSSVKIYIIIILNKTFEEFNF